jgi:hypothetical protein
MTEVLITDAELQKLIAPPIIKFLKSKGLRAGTPSDDNCAYWFPINLELAGTVEIERGEDGTWLIRQDDAIIADRCAETLMIHGAAIAARNRAMEG